MRRLNKSHGFTIVELLVVIVVLAILAFIVISVFTKGRERGITATVQSDLKTAAKQLEQARAETGVYPSDATGLSKSPSTVYQYTVSSGSYCLTANNGTTYYNVNSGSTNPAAGVCSGHSSGAPTTITNLLRDPSVTIASNLSFSVMNDGGYSGPTYGRQTYTSTSSPGIFRNNLSLVGGQTYTLSFWMRASRAITITPCLQWRTSANGSAGPQTCGSGTALSASWTQISVTGVAPPTTGGNGSLIVTNGGGTQFSPGDWLDVDAYILTSGSTIYNYGDGDSPGWAWDNPAFPASSASSGPAL